MIYLNGKQVENIGSLSTRFQAVLSMIKGGLDWFNWAVNDRVVSSINAGNEDQLLKLIQEGLHANAYIRFNTFRASIHKLLTMPDGDIEQLSVIRNTPNDNPINLAVLLQRNQIISYSSISEAATSIASMATSRPDLFQCLSFEEMLALTEFVQGQKAVDNALTIQAAGFAASFSASIEAYINLSLLFQEIRQNQLPANLISLTQNSEIQAIYNRLLPITNMLLYTPSIVSPKEEAKLWEAVAQAARVNKYIGYATISDALLGLARNIRVADQTEQGIQTQLDNFMASVKTLVTSVPASSYNLSQDGKLATLRYEKDRSTVVIGIDDAGNVCLLPATQLNNN